MRTTTLAAYETEVKTIFLDVAVDEKDATTYKDNRVQLSRLRAAWLAAHKAISRKEATANEARREDLDDALEKQCQDDLKVAWKASYPNIRFDEFLTGADSLVGRQFREFRRQCHTLLCMEKVRALAWDRKPRTMKRQEIAAGITLETAGKDSIT